MSGEMPRTLKFTIDWRNHPSLLLVIGSCGCKGRPELHQLVQLPLQKCCPRRHAIVVQFKSLIRQTPGMFSFLPLRQLVRSLRCYSTIRCICLPATCNCACYSRSVCQSWHRQGTILIDSTSLHASSQGNGDSHESTRNLFPTTLILCADRLNKVPLLCTLVVSYPALFCPPDPRPDRLKFSG